MPRIDLADETYVAVSPAVLAPRLTDPGLLAEWFPRLRFAVFMDRGEKGTRWSVSGEVDGSMEVWLEPVGAGTVVHWYLRGEPAVGAGPLARSRSGVQGVDAMHTRRPRAKRDQRGLGRRVARGYVETLNARMFAFKDAAERC